MQGIRSRFINLSLRMIKIYLAWCQVVVHGLRLRKYRLMIKDNYQASTHVSLDKSPSLMQHLMVILMTLLQQEKRKERI